MSEASEYSLAEIGRAAGVPVSAVMSLAAIEVGRYRRFSVPKRSGGFRTIEVPSPALMAVQRAIKRLVLDGMEFHEAAVGFVNGKSVRDHAIPHLGARTFIGIDIENCFPSIKAAFVYRILKNAGYSKRFCYVITRLVTNEGSLPQGAPTSPALCNAAFRTLDNRIGGLCAALGLVYSRYADDLAISGQTADIGVLRTLLAYVQEEGFTPNYKKTRMVQNPRALIVCGISIASGELKLPKAKKRAIRSQAHFLIRNGILAESIRSEAFDPFWVDRVLGRLTFWSFVEPTAVFPRMSKARIASLLAEF